jgi:hypothetical protein
MRKRPENHTMPYPESSQPKTGPVQTTPRTLTTGRSSKEYGTPSSLPSSDSPCELDTIRTLNTKLTPPQNHRILHLLPRGDGDRPAVPRLAHRRPAARLAVRARPRLRARAGRAHQRDVRPHGRLPRLAAAVDALHPRRRVQPVVRVAARVPLLRRAAGVAGAVGRRGHERGPVPAADAGERHDCVSAGAVFGDVGWVSLRAVCDVRADAGQAHHRRIRRAV